MLKEHFGIANLDVAVAPLSTLDQMFTPKSFDYIWCWGVIMFVDRARVMRIFNNLLVEGGVLFLGSVNTPERWAYKIGLARSQGTGNDNFFRTCEKGVNGLFNETGVNAFSRDKDVSQRIVDPYGFNILDIDYDGRIDKVAKRVLPFEQIANIRDENVEMILEKRTDVELLVS